MSTKQNPKNDHKSFADHIGELRTRIAWVVLTFIIASAVAYQFRDILVHIVLAPLGDQKLVYLTPAGGFAFIFQITMYAGAVVSAPLLVYQLYKFVQPALPKRATHRSLRIVLASVILMLAGVFFGYFVAVPAALTFLTTFAGTYIEANLTADSYLNFIVAYVVGLGLLFQLPLLLIFWNWIRPLGPKKLLGSEKFIILFAFIAAAIITPTPDPTNQAMIALPIIIIYQIGVAAVLVMNRGQEKSKLVAPKPAEPTAESAVPALMPKLEIPVVQQPSQPPAKAAVPARQIQRTVVGIDGVRRAVRPTRLSPPMQRAEARLITPSRPVPTRKTRSNLSMDGVSRVF